MRRKIRSLNKEIKQTMGDIIYKTIEYHPYMGLNNKICTNPVTYCHTHHIMLSKNDIANRCAKKTTIDMIEFRKCKVLKYF